MPIKEAINGRFPCLSLWLIALLLSGCSKTMASENTHHKEMIMNPSTILATTHCFGRYLIEVPANFKFSHTYAHRAGIIDIIPHSNQRAFDEIVKHREDGLKAKPHESGNSLHISTLTYTRDQKIIQYWEDKTGEFITKLDGYVLAGKTMYKFNSGTSTSKLQAGTKWVADTLVRVRERAPGEIPTEPGFCIEGGFIKGNENVSERANIGMAPANQPAVRINFNTSTPNAIAPGLIAREDKVNGFFTSFTKLRRGKRAINGIDGEESLLLTTNNQGDVIHLFTWESSHGSADNRRPAIQIEMAAGGPTNKMASPYSDQEAIKLWDSITSTVRVRPGAF